MTDELHIGGKNFVSSKKAAVLTGYAQDYIGQLARGGQIVAQRVGNLWYIDMDSLSGYKTNSEDFKPAPPQQIIAQHPESVVSFDGKDYISASRASKISGYNQDYIGQLARSGKILSRQIGNRWYVERAGLLDHKREKDGLLASVQSEAVGLVRKTLTADANASDVPLERPIRSAGEYVGAGPVLTYFKDESDLMPVMDRIQPAKVPAPLKSPEPYSGYYSSAPVAIRTTHSASPVRANVLSLKSKSARKKSSRISELSRFSAAKTVTAFTVIVVLALGITSMKDSSVYTFITSPRSTVVDKSAMFGAASAGIERLGDVLENLLTHELVYRRQK